jgi:DNA-binding transcriptional regulator YiaG
METSKKLTKEEAITTYLNSKGVTVSTIAAAAGVSPQRLYQWLKAEGVKPNRRPSQRRRKESYTPRAEVEWTAEEIKALRFHMGLTQQRMARELGVRQQTISEWETGMYRPRRSMSKYLTIIAERAGFIYQAKSESTEENDQP